MIAMEIAGAVEVRSGSGVYVLEFGTRPATVVDDSGPGPFELIEARRLIEGEICTLAAERITDQQLARLGKVLDVLGQENQCFEDFEAAHQQFHWLIVEAAGNSALSATVAWLWELRNKSEITTRLRQRIREQGIKPIIDDHRTILEALRQRDGAAARKALNRHLEWLVEYLMKAR
jgi:GntR family transcriptional repressor for pyruvate dehydrogenase complex